MEALLALRQYGPRNITNIANDISSYRGGNASKRKILTELYTMLKPPAIQQLISEDAIRRLDDFIKKPFSDTRVQQRALDTLVTSVAATTKAYHSGKGDDYESVAMVFGNPAAPISLSAAGKVTTSPGKGRSPELLEAMKNYGGHFITVNMDVEGLPAAIRNKGNKGNTYVQVDYTIIIPAKITGSKIKIFLIEFKAGESHLVMSEDEAFQLRKAKALYEMWWGKNNCDITMMYHPFLSGREDFTPELRARHTTPDVVYVDFEGISDFLKLDRQVAENLGMVRGRFTIRLGEAASILERYATKVRKLATQATVATVGKELAKATTKNATVTNSRNFIGNIKLVNALANQGKTVNNIFGEGAGRLSRQANTSNTNWKAVSEKIMFFLLKRESFKPGLTANKTSSILAMYEVTRELLALDKGRILRDDVANKMKKFVADVEEILPRNKNATLPSEFSNDYVIEYIKLRASMLGSSAANYSMDQIDPRDRVIVSEERATAAAAAGAANAAINAVIRNMNVRNINNVNYTQIFKTVVNSNANTAIKKARLQKIFDAFTRRFDVEVTKVAGMAPSQNAINRLNAIANKKNQQNAGLKSNILGRGSRGGLAGNTIRYGEVKSDMQIALKRRRLK
jgi:hypothetical protein